MTAECECERKVLTKKMIGGGYQYRLQCLDCGLKGNAIAQAKLTDEEKAKAIEPNDTIRELYWQRRNAAYVEESSRKQSDWWARYEAYLLSPEWRIKRHKVLERDNYLCQSCMERRATQVHHAQGYRHLFNEPLFELQSVCDECHDRITAMDRGRQATLPYMPAAY